MTTPTPSHFCHNCGKPVDTGARACPSCGALQPLAAQPGAARPRKWLLPVILAVILGCGLLVVVVVLAAVLWLRPTTRATSIPPTPIVLQVEPTGVPVTLEPQATQPGEAVVPTPNAIFEGIGFQLDPTLGSAISGETIPATPPSDDTPPWEVSPAYRQIKINTYPLSGMFHQPEILVYPVDEYIAISPEVANIIQELRKLLASKDPAPEAFPLLPFWNAAQMMRANVRYLDFENGSGVRFITQYGQGVAPISNEAAFYTFQGLTSDGAYYVSMILPVNHLELPAKSDMTQEEYEKLADNYQAYLDTVVPMLDAQPPESFTPRLDALDALVQSLEVH